MVCKYTHSFLAKEFLQRLEGNQNSILDPSHLLTWFDKDTIPMTVRTAGAITSKNYVKRNWKVEEDSPDPIHPSDRIQIKQHNITLISKSPESVQHQLSDAASVIGREDFPRKWPDLIGEMVTKFATGNMHVINGVLHTAHSIFKRCRYEFESEELWTEIKLALNSFAKPLTELFIATVNLSKVHANNPAAIQIIYSTLTIICKVFYSLNFQDLLKYFEDNIKTWMEPFLALLHTNNPLLKRDSDEEVGLSEQLKSQICENVSLFVFKYYKVVSPFLSEIETALSSLLTSTGNEVSLFKNFLYLNLIYRFLIGQK
jgi:exportin-2 (importin alpha re-exporter)